MTTSRFLAIILLVAVATEVIPLENNDDGGNHGQPVLYKEDQDVNHAPEDFQRAVQTHNGTHHTTHNNHNGTHAAAHNTHNGTHTTGHNTHNGTHSWQNNHNRTHNTHNGTHSTGHNTHNGTHTTGHNTHNGTHTTWQNNHNGTHTTGHNTHNGTHTTGHNTHNGTHTAGHNTHNGTHTTWQNNHNGTHTTGHNTHNGTHTSGHNTHNGTHTTWQNNHNGTHTAGHNTHNGTTLHNTTTGTQSTGHNTQNHASSHTYTAPAVGFHVSLTPDFLSVPHAETVVFDHSVVNIGGAYVVRNGHFTAPVSGLYSFSAHIEFRSSDTAKLDVSIVKNGDSIGLLALYGSGATSRTVVVFLDAGDIVWLRNNVNNHPRLYGGGLSTFSGFLIAPVH